MKWEILHHLSFEGNLFLARAYRVPVVTLSCFTCLAMVPLGVIVIILEFYLELFFEFQSF